MMTSNLLGDTGLLLAGVTEDQPKGVKEISVIQRHKTVIQTSTPTTSTATVTQIQTTTVTEEIETESKDENEYEWKIVWRNLIAMVYLHVGALYGLYLIFTVCKLSTLLFGVFWALFGALGVTAGAHRLWTHRSYKAHWIFRTILMLQQTIAFQNHVYEWARDHRAHHKFTDSDADPHNSKRGFFFSHVGWLMVRKHKDVKLKGKSIDMSDLAKDPVITFQRYTYFILMPILSFVIPTYVPWRYFGENYWTAFYVCAIFRYTVSLNFTWFVNSAAHMWGYRPYDRTISPTESLFVGIVAFGEGWHNYHHVFPWDYKARELPTYGLNLTLAYINQMAKLGLAYDLKTVTPEMIAKRAARTGDGSHAIQPEEQVWGWDDEDMDPDHIKDCNILYKQDK